MLLNLKLKEAEECIVQQLVLPINEEASYADTSRRELTVVVNSFPYISVPTGATFDLERLLLIEIQQYFSTNEINFRRGLLCHLAQIFTGYLLHHESNDNPVVDLNAGMPPTHNH